MLFSGGGSDIVGDLFCLWLNQNTGGLPAMELADPLRLAAIFGTIRAGYFDLIGIRDALSPETKIVVHAYDFPQPSDDGVCGGGPWIKPSLDYRRILDPDVQFEGTKIILQTFGTLLTDIALRGARNFHVVPTQGTLKPAAEWANEIHPAQDGFAKLADKFKHALAEHWPQLR
jgi:hypothetical protein